MADIVKLAGTAAALAGKAVHSPPKNRTYADGTLQTQYFQNETTAYAAEVGHLASNVFAAECQGLNPDDFFEWRKVKLRSIRAAQAQTGSTMPGDWQRIYIFAPQNATYLPQGAMVKYADNTWLVYKDKNIAAVFGSAIVRRCNAVVNLLDWYGNVVHLPISYAKMETLGNAPHTTENTITSKNYIACICQINEYSEKFTENTRIILGKTAYAMRGLDDFTREFTDDPESCHLLSFTIERTELQSFDNAELGVADYYGLSWNIAVNYNNSMQPGMAQQLTATSRRNGLPADGDEEHPVSYLYSSSDENVLTVDENGLVVAVGQGTASITVSLAQNPAVQQKVEIEVPAAESEYVAFTTTLPKTLHEGETVDIGIAHFVNGETVPDDMSIVFSGAETGTVQCNVMEPLLASFSGLVLSAMTYAGGSGETVLKLTAYRASPKPLTVTVSSGGYSATATIYLVT